MLKSKRNIALFIGGFIATVLVVMLVSRFRSPRPIVAAGEKEVFFKAGYDFRLKRLLNKDYLEPKFGSTIKLADLETSRREKLSSIPNGDLLLLAVVDPDCAACEASKDIIQSVRKNADELGIRYLPIVFRTLPSDIDLQHYAETLGFETCIRWTSEVGAPETLRAIGPPSHVLTNNNGVILQIWHGTNIDRNIRRRMSDQISSDLYLINDVVQAIRANEQE